MPYLLINTTFVEDMFNFVNFEGVNMIMIGDQLQSVGDGWIF